MSERIIKVGAPNPLACVLSEPADRVKEAPAVILLNSGVMHHVGTCRMSVRICRAFADAGYLAARFDFSGIGDSASRSGTGSFAELARAEIAQVMDILTKLRGADRFVLIGLCSGADAAYETALVDDRVVGICQLDAYIYRNPKYYLHYYGPRVLKLNVWKRFFDRLFDRFTRSPAADTGAEFVELPSYVRVFPPRLEVAAGLRELTERNVELYNIFTGGLDDHITYADQYRDNFRDVDFKDLLKVDHHPACSHIVMEPVFQRRIVADIVDWCVLRCASGHNARAAA